MIQPADLSHCRAAIRTGSLSFYTASLLLPRSVRDPALALYAFCRLADDEVDEGTRKAQAVLKLRDRLDAVYAGTPRNAPEDRAFATLVDDFEMPRILPEALLEGLAWDASGRRYQTLSDVRAYSARVAAAVGLMMCILMRVRDANALARAGDLGVAMQLTNIARDVGEDARAGRLYLPLDWITDAGFSASAFMSQTQAHPHTRRMVRRLLAEARRLYLRSEAGISLLPFRVRPGIYAARHVYAGIGGALRRNAYDSVTQRAYTGKLYKTGCLIHAAAKAAVAAVAPQSSVMYGAALPEVQYLVDAAHRGLSGGTQGRTSALLDVLAELDARETASGIAAE
ncbi:MAG: phytoene/squalene synthase family protein [Pseudomonadota bacterium]